MGKFRVVVDTNVLISALHFGGDPEKVMDLVRRGEIVMFISPFIMCELKMVLREKFNWTPKIVDRVISQIGMMSVLIEPKMRIEVIKEKDADNRILECAHEAGADYLITGDSRHLLPLKQV